MYHEELACYQRLEQAMRPHASQVLHRYMDGLQAWMQGNHYWSLESGRFALTPAQIHALQRLNS
ncbi:hypothetical protein [Nocardia pseudobrasiliensis]|uniref:Uncharacterized protein n=1 Tax=Nocardia pseudobrasiliensis TaxID=45979 RepID=A0A370HKB7_9NOCA|nr:hypothetical protein [Nocardia pseudobrasiliensis]RDI58968.1 hypothetical protein DFR76_1223 [Nocardia pseudobrasiliensis]